MKNFTLNNTHTLNHPILVNLFSKSCDIVIFPTICLVFVIVTDCDFYV